MRLSARQRRAVIARAAGRCEYCRSPDWYAPDPFPIDHIQPRSRGGSHSLMNLAYACAGCNGRKYIATEARDPTTGELALLFHPRQHRWEEHLAWSADRSEILGRTPIGRATIARLELNRPRLLALRRLLRVVGEHPPQELHPTE